MTLHIPQDAQFEKKVRTSFARQLAMETLGVTLHSVEPGRIELKFDHDARLTQQHGFIHGGILTTVMDSACGYAAFSLMPEHSAVLTIEFKTNLLSPARAKTYLAVGKVKKPGRTITVCDGELFAFDDDKKKLAATMTCTLMCIEDRDDVRG